MTTRVHQEHHLDLPPLQSLLAAALPWIETGLLLELKEMFARRNLFKGQVLLCQGAVSREVILVDRGALRLYFIRADGREFNKNFFTEVALLLPLTKAMAHSPSLFGIAALEASEIWVTDHQQFADKLRRLTLWHTVQRKLLAGLVSEKLRREHDLLALSGRERYEQFCAKFPRLAQRIPVGQLASYLGLTMVSLSRIRHAPRAPSDRTL